MGISAVRTHVNPHGGLKQRIWRANAGRVGVRTHVNPHGGLKPLHKAREGRRPRVRTHVNPHGGLKLSLDEWQRMRVARFGPTLILTED